MIIDLKQLKPYLKAKSNLVPLHTWNKRIKGKERGKTPIHNEWTSKLYTSDYINKVINNGHNVGYRVGEHDLIVDLDPRNYDGVDIEEKIADLFDCFDFEEIYKTYPVVKTGGGGYHIYCKLPKSIDYSLLRETVEDWPGVEFKHKGKQVVAAGSKHPNGKKYFWIGSHNFSNNKIPFVPPSLIKLIKRPKKIERDYISGEASINGAQLNDLFLDKLDIENYGTNDSWFPILCAAHHVTGGEGVDEFVDWSTADLEYDTDENSIRSRWESLNDDKDNPSTVGTLIRELEINGFESNNARAVLTFSGKDFLDDTDDIDSEEAEMIRDAKIAADDIDVGEMLEIPKEQAGIKGEAIKAAKTLNKGASFEDKMKCIRLIKASHIEESLIAQEILVDGKTMKQSMISKLLKSLDSKIEDSIVETLSTVTLKSTFKKGKHIILEPNGQLWVFRKTHWYPMSDEYLEGILYRVIDTLKTKIEIKGVEIAIAQHARKAIRARRSVLTSKIHRTEDILPVVNCNNVEIWINKDTGKAEQRKHSYKSYQTKKLNVDYDPSAECPLFMQTLKEIFADHNDCDDLVRHMGEILGYAIQPYKPDANWWLFRGDGGDGKSTILKILERILGDSQLMTTVKILSVGSASANAHAINSLVGKLAVVIEELPTGYTINDAGVKLLSENKTMEANPKSKGHYMFEYVGSLFMCSNYYPTIKGTKPGDLRRYNIIPFNQQFTQKGVDDLDRAFNIVNDKREMAGVLNFLLESYQAYRERGKFDIPVSCADAKDLWLSESNNVARFIKDSIVKSDDADKVMCKATELYDAYNAWCSLNGLKFTKGRNRFYTDIGDLGFDVRVSGGGAKKIFGGELIISIDDFDELEDDEDL